MKSCKFQAEESSSATSPGLAPLNAPYADPGLCRNLLRRLENTLAGGSMRFMEVCGTHTVAIFRSGLRSLLPVGVEHISGPGCPVCVTHEQDVAAMLELAGQAGVVMATFGDLMRVPGPDGRTLWHMQAAGADVRVIYSPLEAVEFARKNPALEVVFPSIGFETTAPLAAVAILAARESGAANFSIMCLNKLIAPALEIVLGSGDCRVDALMLPGHVCTVTGLAPFEPLSRKFGIPCAVSGFEPCDMALALCLLAEGCAGGPRLQNAYGRAVNDAGNPRARAAMEKVFRTAAAMWRGLGEIPGSGLELRTSFAEFDARVRFGFSPQKTDPIPGCRCGDVLRGVMRPDQCPLFGRSCTPGRPVGPCMVAAEGSCAAYFKYGGL